MTLCTKLVKGRTAYWLNNKNKKIKNEEGSVMKKSNYIAMVLGTIGGFLFAIGMCMCLLPEWGAFTTGVVMGGIGAVVILAAVIIWRRMEGKAPIRLSGKTVGIALFSVASAILLGVGMCFAMVWGNMILGIIIGIVGIVMLMSLIPMTKGFKKTNVEVQA